MDGGWDRLVFYRLNIIFEQTKNSRVCNPYVVETLR